MVSVFGVPVIDKSLGAAYGSHDDAYLPTLPTLFHKSTRSNQ